MAKSRMSTKVEDLEGSLGELSNMVQEDDMGLIMEVEEEMVNDCMLSDKDGSMGVIEQCGLLEEQYDAEERCCFSAVESGYKEPPTYKSMLRRPREEREKWIEGCRKEFRDFEKRGVWVKMRINELPPGRKLVGTKWVFKVKRCGRYRSRLVAKGYTQIPGIDYTDNFSPVIYDITLRISLILKMVWDLSVGYLFAGY